MHVSVNVKFVAAILAGAKEFAVLEKALIELRETPVKDAKAQRRRDAKARRISKRLDKVIGDAKARAEAS